MHTKIKEACLLECNNGRTKCTFTSRKLTARENYNVKVGNKPFECVTKCKYAEKTHKKTGCVHE